MRTSWGYRVAASLAWTLLTGCGPPLPPALPPDRPSSQPNEDPLVKAIHCGHAFAAARINSAARASDIAEAAVTACGMEISSAADALAADYVDELKKQHLSVEEREVKQQRAWARGQVAEKVRAEAERAVTENRTSVRSRSNAAGTHTTLRSTP
jgi:hypothetical protein